MNLENPTITIIIPSYNHQNYIEECLKAFLDLDLDKEIFIIDDGSTDETPKIIKAFLENNKNHNMSFIQKPNSGLVSSLNLGLEKAKGKYFYLIASDDIPQINGIKKVVEYLEQNENIDFFIGGGENFFDNGEKTKIYTQKHNEFFNMQFEKRYKKIFLDYPSPLLLQSTIFKTDVIRKIGGWDTSIIWDDYPMFVKLLRNENIKFMFNPNIETVLYRHHGVNSYKNVEKQFMMVKQALEKLAPIDLKNKAIGNALGYYLLKSLLNFNFKLASKLFFETTNNIKLFTIISIFKIIVKKILKIK